MSCKASELAKYIVTESTLLDKAVSNLKLQKLLYFLWVDYYNQKGKYLYQDDICAWQFGPVCNLSTNCL